MGADVRHHGALPLSETRAAMRPLRAFLIRLAGFAFRRRWERELAEELGASILLEGEVMKAGQAICIMARLIDIGAGTVIWGALSFRRKARSTSRCSAGTSCPSPM